jgi:hypothetical protein
MKFVRNFAICLVLVLGSCKNDLELNAPYKEFPSIYAVMNPQDKIQMIRINKVFLGEGDANQMAKVADSVNYQAGDLTVSLERYVNDSRADVSPGSPGVTTISFHDSVITTSPGSFNTTQRIYVTSQKLFTTGIYKLIVKNNKTGNVFTAKAAALDSVDGNQGYRPLTTSPVYPFPAGTPDSPEKIDYATQNGSIVFVPNDAKYGKVYNLTIRCHFYDLAFSGKRYDYVDYVFNNRSSKEARVIGGITFIETAFKKDDFFTSIGVALGQKKLGTDITGRKMYMAEFIVYTSSQEYVDYLEYAKPSLSFNQNKPLYSNFDNQAAIGIFTFRTRCSVKKDMASAFITEFAYNKHTCAYQFYTSTDQLPGCQ